VNKVPAWRIVTGAFILIALVALGIYLTPVYIRNFELQQRVEAIAAQPETAKKPDDVIRVAVVEEAEKLNLPVKTDNVEVSRLDGVFKITVRYIVHVDLPFYQVDLHFYPGAGAH
jgi:hypothetical protein